MSTPNNPYAYSADAISNKWQPIETAPHDGSQVLLFKRGWSKVHLGFRSSDGWCFHDECIWSEALQDDIVTLNVWLDDSFGPTHWMPLPDPPEEGE